MKEIEFWSRRSLISCVLEMKIGLCNAEIMSTVKNASIFNEFHLVKVKLPKIMSQEAKDFLKSSFSETILSGVTVFLIVVLDRATRSVLP